MALANFTADWTDDEEEEEPRKAGGTPAKQRSDCWTVHFDGAYTVDGAGAAAVLTTPTGDKLYYAVQLRFREGRSKVSNNIAEYEGLITGLKAAISMGAKRVLVKGDSQLIVNFSNKAYKAKDAHMMVYLEEVRRMEKRFLGMGLEHIPRGENKEIGRAHV